MIVDAIDDKAACFYQQYGFIGAPEHPRRFYRRMKDVARSLEEADTVGANRPSQT